MSNLFEGLKAGDLEELVLPMISIDEYDSKLDDDSIVVAFYVQDKDPAQDLNRFIQKGAVDLLDTDVSPAPDEDGYFLVFVEILRDAHTPKKILDILDSLTGLTGLTAWKGTFYGHEGILDIDPVNLCEKIRLVSHEDEDEADQVDESLTEFFRASDLSDLVIEGKNVTLQGRFTSVTLEYVDFGTVDVLRESNAVLSQALRLDEAAQSNVSRLTALLGDHWLVEHLHNHVVLSRPGIIEIALFRLI